MDNHGFERSVRDLHPRLLRYARSRVHDPVAEDAVALTLETLWTKWATTESERAPSITANLAFRIVDGHVANLLRADRRRQQLLLTVLEQAILRSGATTLDAATRVLRGEESEGINELLAEQLTPAEHPVARLVLEGYTISEIARVLGVKPGTVSMRLSRARAALRHHRTQDGT